MDQINIYFDRNCDIFKLINDMHVRLRHCKYIKLKRKKKKKWRMLIYVLNKGQLKEPLRGNPDKNKF